jgi:hypothetical protein
MRSLVAATGIAVLAGVLGAAPSTQADCCMGPPVWVFLPINTPLTSTLHPIVLNDDPDRPGVGSVHAYLDVARRRVADLGSVDTMATSVPREISFRVPSDVIRRARQLAHRPGKPWRRGVVKFVIRARDAVADVPASTYVSEGFVSLAPAVRTRHPIRIALGIGTVRGAVRERLEGALLLRVPKSWPRTSPRGSDPTTFGPLRVGGCTAYAYAWTIGVATSDPARYVAEAGGPGETVYAGSAGTRRWRVRATVASAQRPWATAIGIVRIGRRRYAGARFDMLFSPRCGPEAAREPQLLAALRRGVRDLVVRGRVAK